MKPASNAPGTPVLPTLPRHARASWSIRPLPCFDQTLEKIQHLDPPPNEECGPVRPVARRGHHGTGSGVGNMCRGQLVAVGPNGEFVQGLEDGMRGKRGLGCRARTTTAGLIERAGCFAAGFQGAPGIHLPPMATASPPIGDGLAERQRRGPQPVQKRGETLGFIVTPGRDGRVQAFPPLRCETQVVRNGLSDVSAFGTN